MNIQKMMKQAQKMQEQLLEKQNELAGETFESSVGGGKVTVVATGGGDVISIKIAREVVDPEDVEMLEDLVLSGVRQAIGEAKQKTADEMGKLTSGLGMPPGLGF